MNMNLVKEVVADQLRNDLPKLNVGDYVKVDVNIVEGDKKRVQTFEGTIIKMRGEGIAKTFTVRKISNGVVSHSKVRRAKLYYLRDLKGKAAKLKQKI